MAGLDGELCRHLWVKADDLRRLGQLRMAFEGSVKGNCDTRFIVDDVLVTWILDTIEDDL